MIIPDLPNVSAIAFYGKKPPQLTSLIQKLQTYLRDCPSLRGQFVPYQLAQVHGTIIGCEGLATKSGVVNKWFQVHRSETRYINFAGLVNYLQHQVHFPLTIRFGGYSGDRDYQFLSRQQSLYLRSFQLQSTTNGIIPVLIGWSWDEDRVTLEIENLRRSLQQFNLLHKYHQNSKSIDNDFYLRLGTIQGEVTPQTQEAIATEVRNWLKAQSPLYIPIYPENVAVAQYQDLCLNPATTKTISITNLTASNLEQMYKY